MTHPTLLIAMNDTPHEHDDDLLPWLSAAREDAVAPNVDRLDRIGRTARAAFVAAAGDPVAAQAPASVERSSAKPVVGPADGASSSSNGRPMTWIFRTLVLAAAVVGVALVGWMMQPQPVQGFPLGDAFDRLREARSLRLTFREQDGEGTLWVEAPGQMRKEWSPTRYDIVQGSRLWRVDETQSTIEESASPYFDDRTHELDLFAALELADVDQQAVEALRPEAAVTYDDEACFRYEMRIARPEGDLQMVAYAGIASKELKSVLFFPFGEEKERAVPLREFHLVAVNQAPPANAFAARTDLRGDGGIATIMESFGVVTLRPLDQRRWTPVCRETRLFPSDWLRAELRGAHAAVVRMNSGARVTLGPGALVEFLDEHRIRVHDGDIVLEATDDLKEPLVAIGPKEGSFELQKAGKVFLQVRAQNTLARLDASPKWLVGLETTSVGNSLGSLLVEVDGRNVPLTIGEHRVKVTIRDQIARTVIEETFVNETDARLEGVFTFPLPADASISGFAMWVGDERVDADIVEKQRARQIYETILHEKRDPGLLEWTAGNIFQARVFPIEANASKRIRIEYTQVLPMRSGTYRYRYALMSDLLRRNPLDELTIHVDVQSAIPLASIHSPTHAIRLDQNATTAQAEFTAREYVPQSDFEMVFETSGMRPEVVFIPHQRGPDGYFLLQLTPPTEGAWKRAVLQDGPPLKILLLCDTSASMDDASRSRQKELVQATLAALGPEDQFLLATTDVDTLIDGDWQKPTEEARDQALARLDSRLSFGWTDLAKAVAAIAPKCDEETHVLYLGDGIVTVGDATPEPALAEIDRIAKERSLGTFHAMALGSTYEARMLKRLSQIGGGTYRLLNTDDDSARVVQEWLAQIATPGLTDIQLAFEGIRTAAVYPEELLRLPEGMQQIVVGRYQPEPKETVGQAIVTGKLRGEPVKYVAQIRLPAATPDPEEKPEADGAKKEEANAEEEEDSSFIPRLWGKARIDHLLSQSVDGQAKAEIIALSEHFRLITPYTSLLVLESDADRKRFGVKRQVAMRDGEKFFQSAEDKAKVEQRQKLLAQTARYRQGLRMQALAAIASRGRGDQPLFAQLQQRAQDWNGRLTAGVSSSSGAASHWYFRDGAMLGDRAMAGRRSGASFRGAMPMYEEFGVTDFYSQFTVGQKAKYAMDFSGPEDSIAELPALMKELSDFDGDFKAYDPQPMASDYLSDGTWGEAKSGYLLGNQPYGGLEIADRRVRWDRGTSLGLDLAENEYGYMIDGLATASESRFGGGGFGGEYMGRAFSLAAAKRQQSQLSVASNFFSLSDLAPQRREQSLAYLPVGNPYGYPSVEAFPEIFPSLNSAAKQPPAELPLPASWTPEAIRLADRLVQKDDLANDARLAIRSETISHDPRWNRVTGRSAAEVLLADGRWLVRSKSPTSFETVETVSDDKRRAAYPHRGTGRVRDAVKADSLPSIDAYGHGIEQPLYRSHGEYQVRVLSDDGQTATLEMVWSVWKSLLTIDLTKNVVTKIETFRTDLKDDQGQPEKSSEIRFEDYVQAGGLNLPQKKTSFDEEGRVSSETVQSLETLAPEAYEAAFKNATSFIDGTLWLSIDLPSFLIAKARTQTGDEGLEEAWVVFTTEVGRQGWDAAEKALARIRELAVEKVALDEIQFHFDRLARHGEKALATATEKLKELAAKPHEDEYSLVAIWRDSFSGAVTTSRRLEMLDALKPLYDRQPLPEYGTLEWMQLRIYALQNAGRQADAMDLMRDRARAMPWNVYEQIQYARNLRNENRSEEALALLRGLLEEEKRYDESERDQLRSVIAETLEQDRRYQELVDFLQEWTTRDTTDDGAYSRLLWALLAIQEQDEAEELVAKWIDRALKEEKLSDQEASQARAALRYRLGYVHQISRHALTVPMARDLLELGKKLLAFPERWELVTTLFSYSAFNGMEQGAELRKEILKTLRATFRDVTLDQLQTLRSYVPQDGSDDVVAFNRELAAYWEQERTKGGDRKDELTERLWELYQSTPFTWQDRVDYCRKIVAEGGTLRDTFQERLVDLLLDPPTDLVEEMLPAALREILKIGQTLTPAQRKLTQLSKLESAVPVLVEKFFAPKREEIRRLAEKEPQNRADHTKAMKEAQEAAVDKSVALLADFRDEAPEFLRIWTDLFSWSLVARLERDHAAILAALREIVGAKPGPEVVGEAEEANAEAKEEKEGGEVAPNEEVARAKEEAETDRLLRSVLIGRAISMLAWFATEPKAEAELVGFVRGWLEATTDAPKASLAWRQMLYQFLLARDDKPRIEAILRKWSAVREGKAEEDRDLTVPWRRELAMFLAERSNVERTKLDEAIRLFEGLKADRTLDASDLLLLADWKLAQGDEAAWKAIRLEAWELADEYLLSQIVQQVAYAWTNGSHPETLEEETLRQIEALFQKSSNPENYVYTVRDIYLGSKDFRLLANLPRQVVGRTAGIAYAFTQAVSSQLLPSVHEEATLDEMGAVIDELRKTRQGDDPQSVTDRRLLDLLLATVEMRAANVLNQPGPHVQKALAALRRASERPYSVDEAIPAATFLRSVFDYATLGPELRTELLIQMERIERLVGQTSEDRLRIAGLRIQALLTIPAGGLALPLKFEPRQQAYLIGEAAFDDFRKAHPDSIPSALQELLAQRMSMLESDRRFRESERLLEGVEEVSREKLGDDWYETKLLSLWNSALYARQEVSVGGGKALYVALRDAAIAREKQAEPKQREQRLNFLADVFTVAFDKQIPGVREDVDRFVTNRLDEAIRDLPEAFANVVNRYGSLLEQVFSPKRRLAFLLDRLEDYPPLLAWEVDHENRNFNGTIAYLRLNIDKSTTEKLGELEEPTVRFMVQEIQREMRWRQSSQRAGWSRNYDNTEGLFWVAKKDRFRDAALEVLAETPDSLDALMYVTQYLHNDLSMTKDAIVVLEKAWRNGMTDTQVAEAIVSYLRTDDREPEAIPYLLALIERSPSNMRYRRELILAYWNAKRKDDSDRAFDEAVAYLEKHDLRDEGNLYLIGQTGIQVDRAKEGVPMIEEAIRMRELTVKSVASGDHEFSGYFEALAQGYLKLGEGRKAFDAAASSVVVWPAGADERWYPIERLRDVLKRMPDREKFLADWDAEAEKSGKDSQLLRKELGRVLLEEGKPAEAAKQLELAAELGGIDTELDRLRTEAYMAAGDKEGLRRAWIERVRNSPREYDLYLQFARTMEAGDPLIERAVTTTVELDPTEGGSHLALAGWRLERGDLDAARRQYVRAQELRTFDPAGWLGEAEVLLRQERWNDASKTIEKLRKAEWTNAPPDLNQKIDELARKVEAGERN